MIVFVVMRSVSLLGDRHLWIMSSFKTEKKSLRDRKKSAMVQNFALIHSLDCHVTSQSFGVKKILSIISIPIHGVTADIFSKLFCQNYTFLYFQNGTFCSIFEVEKSGYCLSHFTSFSHSHNLFWVLALSDKK